MLERQGRPSWRRLDGKLNSPLVDHLLVSQNMVVMLSKTVGLVADVLEQLANGGMGGQFEWLRLGRSAIEHQSTLM
jgi:hypothetical protein